MASSSARASSERPFYAQHAEAYDLLITDPVEPWVEAVHTRLRPPASVLDAGCGTGRHAAGLISKGHRVDVVDASAELLALAAQRCPSAQPFLADLCDLRLPSTYDAVTCRGVLNDMITDQERTAAVQSLARCLTPGGSLFLDVRDSSASHQRADGATRSRTVDLGDGTTLTFTARTTWSDGLLRVEESYDLAGQRSSYDFTMRPWTAEELQTILYASGLRQVEISAGVGRRTPDRYFVVASA